jgi:hypothetical protein
MAERFSNAVQTTTGKESRIAKVLREPLVQFLALGVGLFLLYFLNGDASRALPDRVVVDETDVARLTQQFQRTWMRPPTRKELEALAEIRPVVKREWSNERRQEANDGFYQALRDRYSVETHLPADGGDNGLAEPAR